ncbi:DUF445 family protein [Paenibacillus yanchengensis]|uniref:DUF445 family protein n=1 Tax=Paenibacillus yanchengensis TaxID=2035833 RepID=A0ABW4YL66_9BACL
MSKKRIRIIANMVIIVSAIGILITFPLQHTFIGGWLFAICSAAVIGGLADSFAVSALFGQPLRIRWPNWMGTNIIAKNRDRLVKELVDMVQHELLSVEQINRQLSSLSFSNMINQYVTKPGTVSFLQQLITLFLKEMLENTNSEKLATDLKILVQKHGTAIPIVELVDVLLDWVLEHKYERKCVAFLASQLNTIVQAPTFYYMINQFIATSLRTYEGDKVSRRLVDQVAGLNSETITKHVQHWLVGYLQRAEDSESEVNSKIAVEVKNLVEKWKVNEDWRSGLEQQQHKLISAVTESKQWNSMIVPLIEKLREMILQRFGNEQEMVVQQKLEQLIIKWQSNEELQLRVDDNLKRWIIQFIEQYHHTIGKMVEDGLNQFDEQQLNELVQDKAGKDLQFIRLNGIIVGGLIGCFIYLGTFWLKGV